MWGCSWKWEFDQGGLAHKDASFTEESKTLPEWAWQFKWAWFKKNSLSSHQTLSLDDVDSYEQIRKNLQDGIPFMGKEWRRFHAHTNTTPSFLKVTILTPVVGILSGYCVVTVSTQAMVCPPGYWFKESMRVTSEAAVKCRDARVQLWGVSVSWHEGAAGHTKLSGGREWVGTNSCYVTRCLSLRESRALRPRLEGSGIG